MKKIKGSQNNEFLTLKYKEITYKIHKNSICHMYEAQGDYGIESHLILNSGKEFIYAMPLDELLSKIERALNF
ncbi:Uncharacterised protein [Providencia rustigianii]|uniref:Uncharacterized protein n=1 Tax=Providencia rustigianii TaxID=158850 RepID=A0A379G5B9_9GAMM|nr:hypothetical protein [Providencia rustigianii]SUC36239.1 Uncharacterised protein [Providencia rustigianii]